ncbi:hypothetical protein B0H13DRAFT_2326933 [Mycena leptocephala]|nr:hypothetical protein B0H13DRAFT_2326933 [Mycena leptocephala]
MSLVFVAPYEDHRRGEKYQWRDLVLPYPQLISLPYPPDDVTDEEIRDLVPLDNDSVSLPRYHAHAHQPICQYEGQMSRTDGEMVEREWAAS